MDLQIFTRQKPVLNHNFTMTITAISEFTDNTSVFHYKHVFLVLLTGTVIVLHILCRVTGGS